MANSHKLVDVIEAAYRLEGNDATWLAGVVEAATPAVDRGMGVYGFEFDHSDPETISIDTFSADNAIISPDLVRMWFAALAPHEVAKVFRLTAPLATISERLDVTPSELDSNPAMRSFCRGLGVKDQLTVRAVDTSHSGVTICTPLAKAGLADRHDAKVWALIASHLSAGYRLRKALAGTDPTAGADAILDPEGRCCHAAAAGAKSQSARDTLRRAAVAIGSIPGRAPARRPDRGGQDLAGAHRRSLEPDRPLRFRRPSLHRRPPKRAGCARPSRAVEPRAAGRRARGARLLRQGDSVRAGELDQHSRDPHRLSQAQAGGRVQSRAHR